MKHAQLAIVFLGLALASLIPDFACAQNAFATSNYRPGGQNLLAGPGPISFGGSILQMPVPDGIYVINAKTSIKNDDARAQSGNCKLWVLVGRFAIDAKGLPVARLFVIDQTEFRVSAKEAGSQQAIALQAAFKIASLTSGQSTNNPNNNVIGVECRAFKGVAVDSVLTAVQITGSIVTVAPALYETPPPPPQF